MNQLAVRIVVTIYTLNGVSEKLIFLPAEISNAADILFEIELDCLRDG